MHARPTPLLLAAALLSVSFPACESGTEPVLADADIRILFVGNSLTDSNDLSALVGTVADVAGLDVSTLAETEANFSLEDHWNRGIADRIRSLRPDVVVMQQGPSSLSSSQVHLRAWSDSLARVTREVGGTPALLMVWPPDYRIHAFDDVLESYHAAAEASGSLFIPAGEAWRELWAEDPDAPLYSSDGFHPSRLGSVVAALTIARVVLGVDTDALPATLDPSAPGLPIIALSADQAGAVQRAVARAVAAGGTAAMDPPAPSTGRTGR